MHNMYRHSHWILILALPGTAVSTVMSLSSYQVKRCTKGLKWRCLFMSEYALGLKKLFGAIK